MTRDDTPAQKRLDALLKERAELQQMLEDAPSGSAVTTAGVAIGFLREQIEALTRQIDAIEHRGA